MNISNIKTQHGNIKLPAFMPDATYGSIRMISFSDAKLSGVSEIVTTTLHIEQKIGSLYIKNFGGVHKFFGWDRPILTDSGGWQVFSLINHKSRNTNKKNIDNKNFYTSAGCSFIDETGKQFLLTPESSIQIQLNLGSDIMTVLDNPIKNDSSLRSRKDAVKINTVWAKRAKKYFDQETSTMTRKPLLGAVIQGANDFELRKVSADDLLELNFDVYNYGGMPLHSPISWLTESPSGFNREMLHYVAELIPNDKIKYAMGVGQPDDIAFCVDVGWDLFDTVLPTRNARHGYLYVTEGQGEDTKEYRFTNQKFTSTKRVAYDVLHLKSKRYEFDDKPLDENCDCEACKTVSRAYLRYLIRLKDPSGFRLATIHNLRFYSKWMDNLGG
jgi:queuine tRNA-ribosyltransferase